jgi:hypothetical protein
VNHDDATDRPTTDPRFRVVLVGVLALALVAALVWLVVLLLGREDAADSRSADREAAELRARQWMLAYGNFGPDDLGEDKTLTKYADNLKPLVSAGFTCKSLDFDKIVGAFNQLVAQGGVSQSTTVERTGVETIDDDSATVLITGEQSGQVKKKVQPPREYQMVVELQKISGDWVVSQGCGEIDSRFKQ